MVLVYLEHHMCMYKPVYMSAIAPVPMILSMHCIRLCAYEVVVLAQYHHVETAATPVCMGSPKFETATHVGSVLLVFSSTFWCSCSACAASIDCQ